MPDKGYVIHQGHTTELSVNRFVQFLNNFIMNKINQSQFDAILRVIDLFIQNQVIIDASSGLTTCLNTLLECKNKVNELSVSLSKLPAKTGSQKKQERVLLIESCFLLGNSLSLYAEDNTLLELQNVVLTQTSKLKNLRDAELLSYSKALKELAAPNMEALNAYGTSQAQMDNLTNNIENFENEFSVPKETSNTHKLINNQIETEVLEGYNYLKDRVVRQMNTQKENTVFYDSFMIAKKLTSPYTLHKKKEESEETDPQS